MLLRGMWTALPAIGFVASLCACAPSSPPAAYPPPAASKPAARDVAAIASPLETPRHYGSSTEPRSRHRMTAKRVRHRYERQQAQAEWVNPPFGAGE